MNFLLAIKKKRSLANPCPIYLQLALSSAQKATIHAQEGICPRQPLIGTHFCQTSRYKKPENQDTV